MIVVTLTDCPPKLRGDLSKWLMEINTGVYVGNLSSRVRDELWNRICENLRTGRATMVFHTNNEQHLEFRVHNTTWEPVDYDGIQLMRRPLPKATAEKCAKPEAYSKAAQYQKIRRMEAAKGRKLSDAQENYTVIDLETTGLHPETDAILELGAIRVRDGVCKEEFSVLLQSTHEISQEIAKMTRLTKEELQHGIEPRAALEAFLDFLGKDVLIGHHLSFDFSFLRIACRKYGVKLPENPCVDTLVLARKKVYGVPNYQLATLAKHFLWDVSEAHRAIADCRLTQKLYTKLMGK